MSATTPKDQPRTQRWSRRPIGASLSHKAEEALFAIASLFEAGHKVSFQRGGVTIDRQAGMAFQADTADMVVRNPDGVEAVLNGPGTRKDWAKDYYEAIFAPIVVDGEVRSLAVAFMDARKTIRDVICLPECQADGVKAGLVKILEPVTGIVVADPSFEARCAIGRLLAELRIGKGSLTITEFSVTHTSDYRDFLAGSVWIEMTRRPAKYELAAKAILIGMQVRSIRRTALTVRKQGYYTALAVRNFAKQGMAASNISTALNLPETLISRWLAPSAKPGMISPAAKAPADQKNTFPQQSCCDETIQATPRQIEYVESICREFPFFKQLLPADWQSDKHKASRFLTTATAAIKAHRPYFDRICLEARAIHAMQIDGNPIRAASILSISPENVDEALAGHSFRVKDLATRLGSSLDIIIESHQILSACPS